jgi:hypothetical protein
MAIGYALDDDQSIRAIRYDTIKKTGGPALVANVAAP